MNDLFTLYQLYNKLQSLTSESKCPWEIASEVDSYYLQLPTTVVRIGERNCPNPPYRSYTFQLVKDGITVIDRSITDECSNEYSQLAMLYSTVRSYYISKLNSIVNAVEKELDSL